MLPTKRSRDHIHKLPVCDHALTYQELAELSQRTKRKRSVQITEHGEQRYALMEANESHM